MYTWLTVAIDPAVIVLSSSPSHTTGNVHLTDCHYRPSSDRLVFFTFHYNTLQVMYTWLTLPSVCHLSASEWLSYLHWLPVHYRIQFKIATLTYKTLATCQPSYLYNPLQLQSSSRALRSSTQQLLQVPYMPTGFGRRTFSYSSPATWNSIPTSNQKLFVPI